MPYGHIKQYLDLVDEAQMKRLQFTRQQEKQIAKMYTEISSDLEKELKRHSEKTLTYRWIKDYTVALKSDSDALYRGLKDLVANSMYHMAKSVVWTNNEFFGNIDPALSERFRDVFSTIPQQTVNELMNGGIYHDFTGLSERIWNYKTKFNQDIGEVIQRGIIAQKPAYQLAKDLEMYLNPRTRKSFEWSRVYPRCNKKVDYNAQRLARTSVTHAYQLSFQRATVDNPFIEKYKWVSSNSSRVCELCLQRNGTLFDKDLVPLDHPNGMCILVPVISKSYEQIADELANWVNGGDDPKLDKWLDGQESVVKSIKTGTIKSGARITNPESREGRAFAKTFYPEIRKRTTDSAKIAKNLGKSKEEIQKIKKYLFIDKSLHDEDLQMRRRFDEDCAIAHSWQRLTDGKNIKKHDRILIEHELYEMRLKEENPNLRHDEAHASAQRKYDYKKEVNEYYGDLDKSDKRWKSNKNKLLFGK